MGQSGVLGGVGWTKVVVLLAEGKQLFMKSTQFSFLGIS